MTTTPKIVILAVVIVLGMIALAVVAGAIVLQATGNGPLPGEVLAIGAGAAGAVGGVLASTRTTPELPPGAVLQQGATTITAPTTAQNAGETASGTPVAAPVAPVLSPAQQFADQFPPSHDGPVEYADPPAG